MKKENKVEEGALRLHFCLLQQRHRNVSVPFKREFNIELCSHYVGHENIKIPHNCMKISHNCMALHSGCSI